MPNELPQPLIEEYLTICLFFRGTLTWQWKCGATQEKMLPPHATDARFSFANYYLVPIPTLWTV